MFRVSAKNLFLLTKNRFLGTSAALLKPLPPPPLPSSSLVDYLVKSLDLRLEAAISISRKLDAHRNGLQKADSVLMFLRSCGFSKVQMTKLVSNKRSLLLWNVESNLKPKLEYFREIGLSESVLLSVIAGNSQFFCRSLDSYYKPQIEFLQKYLRTPSKLDVAIKRCSWLLTVDRKYFLVPNIDLLVREGVKSHHVALLMRYQPSTLVMKVEKVASHVKFVKGLGLEPSSTNFIHCIRVMSSMSESTWNNKVENFKNLGWSQEDILSMFVRYPLCLALSEKKIRTTVDFYLNTASIAQEVLVSQPVLLQFSVDKRLRPRLSVIAFLSSKGLLKKFKSNITLFRLTEELFVKRYVMKHEELVPNLMEIYRSSATVQKSI